MMEDRVFRSSIFHLYLQLIKTSRCKSQKEVAMKVLRMRSWNFHADNLDQMTRFYQNALGAEVRTQHTVGGVNVTRLRAGETGLGLFDAAEKRAPGVPHHTFDIEGPKRSKGVNQGTGGQGNQSGRFASSRRRPRLLGLCHRPQRESARVIEGLECPPRRE